MSVVLASWFAAAAGAADWPSLDDIKWESTRDGRDDWALVMGVENYPFLGDAGRIPGAVQSARDWVRWLEEARGVPEQHVRLLVDNQVTRRDVQKWAGWLAENASRKGTVWVVYVGHGATSTDGRDGLLVGVDAQPNPESFAERSVRRSELETWVEGAQEHTVMVLDACFSGKTAGGQALAPGLQAVVPSALAPANQLTVLAAAQSHEYAGQLPGLARPAFSYLVLGALSGWGDQDRDRSITAREAVDYARSALQVLPMPQSMTPELLGEDLRMGKGRAKPPKLREIATVAAAGPAAAPTPTPVVGATSSTADAFDAIATPDVDAVLVKQRCQQQAAEAAAREAERRLAAATEEVVAKAERKWEQEVGPAARKCLEVADTEQRATCASSVERWLQAAEAASVSIEAGVHEAPLEGCPAASRAAAYEAQTRSVSIPSVAQAQQLLAQLTERPRAKRKNNVWQSFLEGFQQGLAGGGGAPPVEDTGTPVGSGGTLSAQAAIAEQHHQQGHLFQNQGNFVGALGAFQQAADMGSAGAMRDIGIYYANGWGGLPMNMPLAIQWYQKAARGGDVVSQQWLVSNGMGW